MAGAALQQQLPQLVPVSPQRGQRQGKQHQRQRQHKNETHVLEAGSAYQPAHQKHGRQPGKQAQPVAVRLHIALRGGAAAVPVEHLAHFDAQVSHHAGHVRGADLGRRHLGDHCVLQAHEVGQQQHREGHSKRRAPAQRDGPHQAKQQHENGFEQQRQRVGAVQLVVARPVHQNGRAARPRHEGPQRAHRTQHQLHVAQHQVVGQ